MKYIFILNPNAGTKNFQYLVDEIKLTHKRFPIFDYDLLLTQGPKHATQIAKSYQGQEVTLVACGGDGTLNEVLNGMDLTKHILANIPLGSGNDFLKSIQITEKSEGKNFVADLVQGDVIEIDCGLANGHRFINSCNFGLDADVLIDYEALRQFKMPRNLTYIMAALKVIGRKKVRTFHIDMDGQKRQEELLLMTINNGQYYGGSFWPTPMALLDDGWLDYVSCRNLSRLKLLRLLAQYQKGTHLTNPAVSHGRVKKIHISSDQDFVHGLDGEIFEGKELSVELHPKSVRLISFTQKKKELGL